LAEENNQESCNAYYEVKIVSVNGGKNLLGNPKTKVGNFSARCDSSKSESNNCRRRARDSAQHCMLTHLHNQELNLIPEECQSSSYIYDYTVSDLQRAIEVAACSLHPYSSPDLSTLIISVYSVTEGNKGCGPDLRKTLRNEVISSYSVTCQRRRK